MTLLLRVDVLRILGAPADAHVLDHPLMQPPEDEGSITETLEDVAK